MSCVCVFPLVPFSFASSQSVLIDLRSMESIKIKLWFYKLGILIPVCPFYLETFPLTSKVWGLCESLLVLCAYFLFKIWDEICSGGGKTKSNSCSIVLSTYFIHFICFSFLTALIYEILCNFTTSCKEHFVFKWTSAVKGTLCLHLM